MKEAFYRKSVKFYDTIKKFEEKILFCSYTPLKLNFIFQFCKIYFKFALFVINFLQRNVF